MGVAHRPTVAEGSAQPAAAHKVGRLGTGMLDRGRLRALEPTQQKLTKNQPNTEAPLNLFQALT
eukprot:14502599-Alexandrium_andersonii.AAC.1